MSTSGAAALASIPFAEGKDYTRADIARTVGGPVQPGISTPKRFPFVLIFTGGRGKKFGYKDRWTSEGTFVYTGQGKRGEMTYRLGNKAIADTPRSGKGILLFHTQTGRVQRYFGRLRLLRTWTEQLPDESGSLRRAILFELAPISTSAAPATVGPLDRVRHLAELKRRAREGASHAPARKTRESVDFERSPAIVTYARARAGGTCEACGAVAPFVDSSGDPFLICHHIQSLSDEGPDDPEAVGAICPNCHYHIHYGRDGVGINARLGEVVRKKEQSERPVGSSGTETGS
jgi:5-methylcytosine-specific restriction protein A